MAPGLTLSYASVGTPLGEMTLVVSEAGVVLTSFDDEEPGAALERAELALHASARRAPSELAALRREVRAYFSGSQRAFSAPPDLRLVAAGFPRRVLAATARIPYGELRTYGDVAAGNALARCPIELFVPCHRVVHAGRTLGGYGRHESRKRWLLRHEGLLV